MLIARRCDLLHGNLPRRAGDVVHEECLAQGLGQLIGEEPCRDIGRAAWRIGNDDLDGSGRPRWFDGHGIDRGQRHAQGEKVDRQPDELLLATSSWSGRTPRRGGTSPLAERPTFGSRPRMTLNP